MASKSGKVASRSGRPRNTGSKSDWVTKSDIMQYERCPYTYWLLYSQQISAADVFGEQDARRIAGGVQFEENLLNELPVVPDDLEMEELSKVAKFLFDVPTSSNEAKKICGRPDGVELETYAPIEIKSHNTITRLDRIELAFYWHLLEQEREDTALEPYGWICRPRWPEPTRVALNLRDFARVEHLVEAVRKARRVRVEPRVCRCAVCSSRLEVASLFANQEDVGLIWGIGHESARVLGEAGIDSLSAFVRCDAQDIAVKLEQVSGRKYGKNITIWRHHARAFVEQRAVRFSDVRFSSENYIVLDLEYDVMEPGGIWLIGLQVVCDGQQSSTQMWCENRSDVTRALKKFHTIPENGCEWFH